MSHTDFIIRQYDQKFLTRGDGKDFDWLQTAQNDYNDAFKITTEFIKDIEDNAFSISMEYSKIPPFTGNSLLWMIIIPVLTFVLSVQIYDWGNLKSDVGNYTVWILLTTLVCVSLEYFFYQFSTPPAGNVNVINRLQSQWKYIIENELTQEDAKKQINLFILYERSIHCRQLMKTPLKIVFQKYTPIGVMLLLTLSIVVMSSHILHDKNIVDMNEEKKALVCTAKNWKSEIPQLICQKTIPK